MLALTNDHGDHSFLLINSNNTSSGHSSRLLVERAFFNDPKERAGCYPFLREKGRNPTASLGLKTAYRHGSNQASLWTRQTLPRSGYTEQPRASMKPNLSRVR